MRKILTLSVGTLLTLFLFITAVYANPDVAGVIGSTWTATAAQIKQVVNTVVFPVINVILAVFFFVKLGMAYFDYKKHGQFEWAAPAILFACLVFTLTAPTYLWTIIGM